MTRPTVQIFSLKLDAPGAGGEDDVALLDAAERARAERFRFDRHRRRFVAAHAGTRRCLSQALGQPARSLRLHCREHEKPRLLNAPSWAFNLSHSGELALVAVSDAAAVGVDVEMVRDLPDFDAVAREVFASDELAELASLPFADRAQGFFRAWTRKEAVIKTTGEGFRADLKSFSVSLRPGGDVRFVRPPPAVPGSTWGLRHLDPGANAIGAVAMAVPGDDGAFDLVTHDELAVTCTAIDTTNG